jgi:hypothetical protein
LNAEGNEIKITSTREQARALLEALAGNEPDGFEEAMGGTFEELYPRETRRVLKYFGIDVSEAAMPPEVIAPPKEHARRAIEKLDLLRSAALIEPHIGFRPPLCGDPPAHSATMGYVFSVIAQLAEPPA